MVDGAGATGGADVDGWGLSSDDAPVVVVVGVAADVFVGAWEKTADGCNAAVGAAEDALRLDLGEDAAILVSDGNIGAASGDVPLSRRAFLSI